MYSPCQKYLISQTIGAIIGRNIKNTTPQSLSLGFSKTWHKRIINPNAIESQPKQKVNTMATKKVVTKTSTKRIGYLNGEFIENTPAGLAEIETIKKLFKGTKYKVRVRNRNPDIKGAVEAAGLTYGSWVKQEIPKKFATRFTIYVMDKTTGTHLVREDLKSKEREDYYRLQREVVELRTKVRDLERQKSLVKEIILGAANEVVKFMD